MGDLWQRLSFWQFEWECIKYAFRGRFWYAEKISGGFALFAALLPFIAGKQWEPIVTWLPFAVFLAVFVGTVATGLALAPYRIYRERTSGLERDADALRQQMATQPDPEFSVLDRHNRTCLQIKNRVADARFTVRVDYRAARGARLPDYPVLAQWSDKSGAANKLIPANTDDYAVIFETEIGSALFTKTNYFLWYADNAPQREHSTSWIIGKNAAQSIPPSGFIKISVSSEPTMYGGSFTMDLEYEGDRWWVTSDGVRLHQ